VVLRGEIEFDVDAPVRCAIKDFSQNGLSIEVAESDLKRYTDLGSSVLEGLIVPIHLHLDSADSSSSVTISTRVVRVLNNQIGVAYLHDEAALVAELTNHIVYTPTADRGEALPTAQINSHDTALDIRREVLDEFLVQLGSGFDLFAQHFTATLFSAATDSIDGELQNQLLHVLGKFEAQQAASREVFVTAMGEGLEGIANPSGTDRSEPSASPALSELSLVDNDEMESRLLINSATAALERTGGEPLNHAMMRLAVLSGLNAKEQLPEIAPKRVVETLLEQIEESYATVQARGEVFKLLESAVIAAFGTLYSELNDRLKARGVVPDIRVLFHVEHCEPDGGGGRGSVIASLSGLLDRRLFADGGAEGEGSGVTIDRLIGIIDTISGKGRSGQRLAERIGGSESDLMDRLSSHDRRVMELSTELFNNILGSDNLSPRIKDWLAHLEGAYTKTILLDDTFIDNQQHPARRLLGLLTDIGLSGDEISAEMEAAIDPVVERLVSADGSTIEDFSVAMDELTPLAEGRNRKVSQNLESVIDSCEGDQVVRGAKQFVTGEMRERLLGREVSAPLERLFESAWRQALTLIYMRKGEGSEAWQRAMELTGSLGELLNNRDVALEKKQALLSEAEALVDEYHCGHLCDQGLFDQLQAAVEGRASDASLTVPGEDLVEIDNSSEIFLPPEISPYDDESIDESLRPWLDEAVKLKIGTWFRYGQEDESPFNVRLSWIGQHYSRFVFVNSLGMKALDLRLHELGEVLRDGTLVPISEQDLSFVDNSIELIVERLYGQLAFQASHDELTGLVNRKEFERRLGLALTSADSGEVRHVLGFISVHQIDAIRKLHGYGAGNQLLKELSTLLNDALEGGQCTLSRMGVDEFSVLYEECTIEEAYRFSGKQVDRVQEYRYRFDDTPYSVSISIGLVAVTADSKFAPTVLNEAELACTVAKSAGRNSIKIYEQDDEKLQQLDSELDWIVRVNRIMDEGRIEPYVQEIAPILDRSEKMHYEVLMRVLDEQGVSHPPSEFIDAAEKHNLMHEVDQRIIHKVFEWIDTNPAAMREIGSISINLSGQSLGSERLLEYVFEQMALYHVPRKKICFEITETAAITNFEDATDFIDEMRNLGCSFSLDDFGSGLSSYAYLKKLPVDYLKIDGVLVKDICSEPNDYAMVRSIKEVAHFMGKRVIAEYAENDEVVAKLAEIGVDFVQGYAIARPHPLSDLEIKEG